MNDEYRTGMGYEIENSSGLREIVPDTETKERMKSIRFFGKLAPACLIYALIYVFCMYDNAYGVMMPFWIASIIGLIVYAARAFDKPIKKDSRFLVAVMFLIGISNFLTGSESIMLLNFTAVFLLTVTFLLHNFADDGKWDFGKYFAEIVSATCGAVTKIVTPLADGGLFFKSREKKADNKAKAVIIGIVITIPVLVILILLLSSADMIFEDIFIDFFNQINIPSFIFKVLLFIVFGFFSAYCGLRFVEEHAPAIKEPAERKYNPVTAIVVSVSVAVLYLFFCWIQVRYLFIGGVASVPKGITYAEYAREGFAQLMFVSLINLVMVLVIKKYFGDNKILNVVLIIISGCTYCMIASSALRMYLYISAYHLTVMRVYVMFALLLIAVLFIGVIIKICNKGFNFFRYGIAVVSVIYLIMAFSHMDYFIAKYNLSAADRGLVPDMDYMSELSSDAAPLIAEYVKKLPEELPDWYQKNYAGEIKEGTPYRTYYETNIYVQDYYDFSEIDERYWRDSSSDMYGWYYWYLVRNRKAFADRGIRRFNVSHIMARAALKFE